MDRVYTAAQWASPRVGARRGQGRNHVSGACIPWLASKKHDIQRGRGSRGSGGLRRFPKIPQASAKSNEQGVGGVRGTTGNIIPRAPRANYVKI